MIKCLNEQMMRLDGIHVSHNMRLSECVNSCKCNMFIVEMDETHRQYIQINSLPLSLSLSYALSLVYVCLSCNIHFGLSHNKLSLCLVHIV